MMMDAAIIDMLAQMDRTLERIAVALERLGDDAGRCEHGVTRQVLCKTCLIDDLMWPR